jgi:hypothetical protein
MLSKKINMNKKDIRLYSFDGDGNLRKVGEYKTDRKKYQRHFFESVEDARQRVDEIMNETKLYRKGTQFLIIEYYFDKDYWRSKILELINK